MGKTIVEKILAKAAELPEVSPGEYVKVGNTVKFVLMGTDSTPKVGPAFNRLGWDKLWDPTKVMIAPDHCGAYTRVGSITTNREAHRLNSEWARSMGVPEENIMDLGRVGNCHHLAVEKGWALPGSVYLSGPDGHTITVGGVGCFGSCLSASANFFMRFGWTWFRVPESIKFNITGKLKDGIMGRDVYEYILGLIGPGDGIHWSGDGRYEYRWQVVHVLLGNVYGR